MSDVVTTDEASANLERIARRFDAGDDEPVYFGADGRPQGVIVPMEIWERFLADAEDEYDLRIVAERIAASNGRYLDQDDVDAIFDRLDAQG